MNEFSLKNRNAQCPCDSGKKIKKCCGKNDRWYKEPARLKLPDPRTGFCNSKCYLNVDNNCSQDISREHYISKSVLRTIERNGDFKISGLSWLDFNSACVLSSNSMASKILCSRHNEALSVYDTQAARFFEIISNFEKELRDGNTIDRFKLFNYEDIERWIIKTAYGMSVAGILRSDATFPSICCEILLGASFPKRWGLYPEVSGEQIHHAKSISIELIVEHDTNEVVAIKLWVNNIDFYMFVSDSRHNYDMGIYRPQALIFKKDNCQKVISFGSENVLNSHSLIYLYSGEYSGVPPNWPKEI